MSLLQPPPSLGKRSSEDDLGERRLKEKKMEDQWSQERQLRETRMRRRGLYCCACEERRALNPNICSCGHYRSRCPFCLSGETELSTETKAQAKSCMTESENFVISAENRESNERERENQAPHMPKPTIESERIRIPVEELCASLKVLKLGILSKTYNRDQQTAFSEFADSIGKLGYEVYTAMQREKLMKREEKMWREERISSGVEISNDRDGDEIDSAAQYNKSDTVDGDSRVDFVQTLANLAACEKKVSMAALGNKGSFQAIEQSLAKILDLLPTPP